MAYRKRRPRRHPLRTFVVLLALAALALVLAKRTGFLPLLRDALTPLPSASASVAMTPSPTPTDSPAATPTALAAAMQVLALGCQPESPVAGQPMTVQVQARNTGGQVGDFSAAVTLDGAPLGTVEARLEAGETRILTLDATAPAAGAHALELPGLQATLHTLRPADISIAALGSDAPYGSPNTELAATVTLSNAGDEAGSFPLKILLNGKAFADLDVPVPALEFATVPLTVPLGDAGAYRLQAGGQECTLYAVKLDRPANGAVLVKSANTGYGRLTIDNRNTQDALVLLSSQKKPDKVLLAVYVRAGAKTTAIKVKDGSYLVYYTTGDSFDTASRRFTAHARSTRFSSPMKFSTSNDGSSITYSTWSIELGAGQGDTQAENVPTAELPQ